MLALVLHLLRKTVKRTLSGCRFLRRAPRRQRRSAAERGRRGTEFHNGIATSRFVEGCWTDFRRWSACRCQATDPREERRTQDENPRFRPKRSSATYFRSVWSPWGGLPWPPF